TFRNDRCASPWLKRDAPLVRAKYRVCEPAAGSLSLQAPLFFRVFAKFPFDVLTNSMHLAIRELNCLGSSPIFHSIFSKARPHGDRLADIIGEILSLGTAPFESRERNGFKCPRGDVSVRFLYIQV